MASNCHIIFAGSQTSLRIDSHFHQMKNRLQTDLYKLYNPQDFLAGTFSWTQRLLRHKNFRT